MTGGQKVGGWRITRPDRRVVRAGRRKAAGGRLGPWQRRRHVSVARWGGTRRSRRSTRRCSRARRGGRSSRWASMRRSASARMRRILAPSAPAGNVFAAAPPGASCCRRTPCQDASSGCPSASVSSVSVSKSTSAACVTAPPPRCLSTTSTSARPWDAGPRLLRVYTHILAATGPRAAQVLARSLPTSAVRQESDEHERASPNAPVGSWAPQAAPSYRVASRSCCA